MLKSSLNNRKNTALYIALIYFFVGIIWILVSDRIAIPITPDKETVILFQTIKGIGYVTVTALLLYLLINRSIKQRNSLISLLKKRNNLLQIMLKTYPEINLFLINNKGDILQGYGNTPLFYGKNSEELTGHNINNIPIWDSNKEITKNFVKELFVKEKSEYETTINNEHYYIKGFVVEKKEKFKTHALILLENNEKLHKMQKLKEYEEEKKENALYTIEKQKEELFECGQLLNIFDYVKTPVILQNVNNNGTPGELFRYNNQAKSILNTPKAKENPSLLWDNFSFNNKDKKILLSNNFFYNRIIITNGHLKQNNSEQFNLSSRLIYAGKTPYVLTVINAIDKDQKTSSSVNSHYDAASVLDSISEGIMLINRNMECIYTNPAMSNLTGYRHQCTPPTPVNDLIEIYGDINYIPLIKRALKGETAQSNDFQFENKPHKWFKSLFYPVFNENGETVRIIRIIKDVTSHHQYEEKLHNQYIITDQSNQLRTIFLSNLSHEIRTPMNGISGFVELLEQEPLSKNQQHFINLIKESSSNLLKILDALVEVSALENGQINIENSWTPIQDIANEIENYTINKLQESNKFNITSKIVIDHDNLPNQLYFDKDHIVKALKLLIDNAVKFTLKGTIEIKFTSSSSKEDFIISISDTGVGINKQNLQSIFLPFTTFNHSEDVLYGGIGLGLTIVQSLINLSGGSIEVESEKNRGSTFYISLPLRMQSKAVLKQGEKNIHNRPKKIMIVQYGPGSVYSTIKYLEKQNIKVVHTDNGAEAVATFFEQKDIDMIFCDIKLADMDGFELLKALRKIDGNITVVAQASYFIPEEKRRALAEGFDEYLVKPIDSSLLIKTIKINL
ncbi:ATP-binding protein [Marinilabiliaceae bacterium ANBcel2]|nr:ATP-binding protein [Marinilabiliaceae bacterium ANBcel2]